MGILGDRIPVKWHGWLSNIYEDVPSDGHFVDHSYIKEHNHGLTFTEFANMTPGSISPYN